MNNKTWVEEFTDRYPRSFDFMLRGCFKFLLKWDDQIAWKARNLTQQNYPVSFRECTIGSLVLSRSNPFVVQPILGIFLKLFKLLPSTTNNISRTDFRFLKVLVWLHMYLHGAKHILHVKWLCEHSQAQSPQGSSFVLHRFPMNLHCFYCS